MASNMNTPLTTRRLNVNDKKLVLGIKSIPKHDAPVVPVPPTTSINSAPVTVPGPSDSQVRKVALDDIQISGERRACRPENVRALAESMDFGGLKTPITVRRGELPRPATGEPEILLVCGRHRVDAARLLGWTDIDAVFFEGDETDARIWEISENLHRANLTALEYAEHVAEWARLTEARTKALPEATPAGGQQPSEKGVRKAARDLGLDASTVSRSVKIDGIAPEAKQVAKDVGLDDRKTALLTIAKKATPAAQVALVHEIAAQKARPRVSPQLLANDRTMVAEEIERVKVEQSDRVPEVDGELEDVGLAPSHQPSCDVTAALPGQHDTLATFEVGSRCGEQEQLFQILSEAWANSPTVVRERFIREVLRDKEQLSLDMAS